jgi:hypothetical protein
LPSALISPATTALAPSRVAISRASALVIGAAGSRCIRVSASLSCAVLRIRTTGDWPRSIRNASVIEPARPESALRFSKSATTSWSLSLSRPEATSVPTGPIPKSRIAV